MIIADKNFTIKNAQGFTSPEINSADNKIYISVGSNISPMGTFSITGMVMKKVETTENVITVDEETQEVISNPVISVSYEPTGILFPVPNTMQNTPTLDVVTEASNIAVALLEEWNAGVDFTVEL